VGLISRSAKVAALKRVSLFEGLSRRQLVEIAKVAEDVDFGAAATANAVTNSS
jgi:hypothetical protein